VVDASGNQVSTPATTVDLVANTVTVSVAKDALSDVDVPASEVLPVVGSESFGSFRDVEVDATQWTFGGARSGAASNAPRAIDLLAPQGTTQGEALAYDGSSLATLPFTPL
jgi:carbohydrate-binding DOMON domain-containing protein